MKIKSMEDLQRIQRQYQQQNQQAKIKLIVGMGTCGIAAGASEVLKAVEDEVLSRGLEVDVTQTGCIGMCEQEPLLDVQVGDERVTYIKVNPQVAREIVDEHVVNGRVHAAALARRSREA